MSHRLFSRLKPSKGFVVVFTGSALAGGGYRYFYSSPDEQTGESLSQSSFTPYSLLSKETVNDSSSVFFLEHPQSVNGNGRRHSAEAIREIWRKGIWSVQAKQPELQIARSYTPLPPTASGPNIVPEASVVGEVPRDAGKECDLRLLIRAEKNGEVSNYLHNLPENSTIDLRGPFLELELPEDLRQVIFIAGGTGIAPALQVAHALSQRNGARMHILWNTRHREECRGGRNDAVGLDTSQKKPSLEQLNPWGRISQWTTWGLASGGEKPESALAESRRLSAASMEPNKGPIVQELEALQRRFEAPHGTDDDEARRLTVEYFVDDDNRFIKPRDLSRYLKLVANREAELGLASEKKLILVSGPEGFVSLWAGKKVWMGGKETQGPLGGYFANLGLSRQGWRVWKL